MTAEPASGQSAMDEAAVSDGPGHTLKQARLEKKKSVAEVASELRLDTRIIDSLESNDYSGMPAAIFVRGYLRSYARLLGLDEGRVLAACQVRDNASPPPLVSRQSQGRLSPPRMSLGVLLKGLALALVVTAMALVGYLGWERYSHAPAMPEEASQGLLPLPPQGYPEAEDAPGAKEAEAVAPPPAESVTDAVAPAPPDTALLAETEAAHADAMPAQADLVGADAPAAAEAAAAPAVAATSLLELFFEEDCWVDIRDGEGQRIVYGLKSSGTRRSLQVIPPVSLVLGNAAGVSMNFNGEPVDVQRHSRGNLARFSLGN